MPIKRIRSGGAIRDEVVKSKSREQQKLKGRVGSWRHGCSVVKRERRKAYLDPKHTRAL